jgi:hypothetical protein
MAAVRSSRHRHRCSLIRHRVRMQKRSLAVAGWWEHSSSKSTALNPIQTNRESGSIRLTWKSARVPSAVSASFNQLPFVTMKSRNATGSLPVSVGSQQPGRRLCPRCLAGFKLQPTGRAVTLVSDSHGDYSLTPDAVISESKLANFFR